MEGFEKIDLGEKGKINNSEIPDQDPPRPNKKRKTFKILFNRKILAVLAVLLILVLISTFTIVLPFRKTYEAAKKTYGQARVALDAVKKQNISQASLELSKTRQDLKETQDDLSSLGFIKFIPILNGYYRDANHLINGGFYALDASEVLVDSIKPYADVLGLKGQGSFVGGTAQQRIQTAVTTMGKVTPHIDDIYKYLALAKSEIDLVDPNHYPAILGGAKIKGELFKLRKITDDGVVFIGQARPLIKILPSLLGEPKEKKYLVLFQNDKELRPTGGFITAYSIFTLIHGVIHVDTSSDIYSLDGTIPGKPPAPRPILEYLPKVSQFNIRDSNLSPDFAVSMQTFSDMYKKSSMYEKVDGIIAVDTQALVSAMNILGDVQADGMNFTTKNDPVCNCPQVIYELEAYSDQPVGRVRENRKGIIGDLMYSIMNKAFSSSPKLYWGPLFQTMLTEISQKHILFYINNKDAQSGIDALNAGGRIQSFNGDYLHINEANFGGAKSNLYVSENVLQNYDVKSDGSITKTVTINYKNPYPPSDCNLARGGLCLNAVLRDWVRIYVPKGSELISSRGSEVKLKSYDDLGKTVFEGFITVRPEGASTFTISYRLPFKLANGSPLPLLIQKQPGTDDNEYTVTVNGSQTDKFKLSTDRELKVSIR